MFQESNVEKSLTFSQNIIQWISWVLSEGGKAGEA